MPAYLLGADLTDDQVSDLIDLGAHIASVLRVHANKEQNA